MASRATYSTVECLVTRCDIVNDELIYITFDGNTAYIRNNLLPFRYQGQAHTVYMF
jgi:hypothetical protein